MTTPIPATPATATLDDLRQTLHDLHSATKLSTSPWMTSCLVTQKRSTRPELAAEQTLKAMLTDVLALLETEDKRLADLLRGRFWNGLTVTEMVAAQRPLAQSERHFYNQQNRAIERFAVLLAEQEHLCLQKQSGQRLLARLPIPTYQQLFGVEIYNKRLDTYLSDLRRHPIISIKGIGGIGKTSLADYAVRRRLAHGDRLHDLIWLSAKQEYLTDSGITGVRTQVRLEQLFDELGLKLELTEVLRLPLSQKIDKLATVLRTAPYLVVLDNLESVEDFRQIVPWLERLAGPTQFLLTARETVPALTSVTELELGELAQPDALALIEYMTAEKDVHGFDPSEVYALVGGNPLAILLVVSQMRFLPENRVLTSIQLGDSDELYTYIFRNAWSVLGEEEKIILFTLQRAGDQADWEWLNMSTALPAAVLDSALGRLCALSLVHPQRGNDGPLAFTIHRLTSTFLRTEVLGWK